MCAREIRAWRGEGSVDVERELGAAGALATRGVEKARTVGLARSLREHPYAFLLIKQELECSSE